MRTDTDQLMRVITRCIQTAAPGDGTAHAIASVAERVIGDPQLAGAVDGVLSEIERDPRAPDVKAHWRTLKELILRFCQAEMDDVAADWAATALCTLLTAGFLIEESSLGTPGARHLRNRAFHGDIAAVRARWAAQPSTRTAPNTPVGVAETPSQPGLVAEIQSSSRDPISEEWPPPSPAAELIMVPIPSDPTGAAELSRGAPHRPFLNEAPAQGEMPAALRMKVGVTRADRAKVAGELRRRYEAGESIRALAAATGRSYGFVHRILTENGVSLRGRR